MENNEIDLAKNIRMRRVELGLEQKTVAEAAGLWPNQLSNIENGKQRIRAECLPKIAAALACTVAQLYGEKPMSFGEYINVGSDDFVVLISPGALERYAQDAVNNTTPTIREMQRHKLDVAVSEPCEVLTP